MKHREGGSLVQGHTVHDRPPLDSRASHGGCSRSSTFLILLLPFLASFCWSLGAGRDSVTLTRCTVLFHARWPGMGGLKSMRIATHSLPPTSTLGSGALCGTAPVL